MGGVMSVVVRNVRNVRMEGSVMSETEFMKAIDSASSLTDLAEIEAQINASGLPESTKERLRALIAARRRELIKPPRG